MAQSSSGSRVPVASPTTPSVQRAKKVGGPVHAPAYQRAKPIVAAIVRRSIAAHVSQREVARVAGVTHRLVQQWCDPEGCNGLRLDVAMAIAEEGGPSCRNMVIDVLRDVLAVVESGIAKVPEK